MPSTKTPRYKYKPPKAEMRATQPNPVLQGISTGLGYLRDAFDTGNIGDALTMGPVRRLLHGEPTRTTPPTTRKGLGTLMMGGAPEEVHEWASGFSPFSEEPNLGNRLDPRIKPGREQGLIDVAMTGADIAGLGLAGLRKGVRAAYPTLNPEVNMSRREFMGNTGKTAAGLAAASAVPFALRGTEHAAPVVERAVQHAAPHAAAAIARATPHEFFGAMNSAERIAKAHYNSVYAAIYDRELAKAVKEGRIIRTEGIDTPHSKNVEVLDEIQTKARNEALDKANEVRNRLTSKIKEDPQYAGYETISDTINRIDREEHGLNDDFYGKAVEEWKKKHGILEDTEIVKKLRAGEDYIDPQSGHEAFLNMYRGVDTGDLMWRDLETGEERRYSHWMPDKFGAPKHFPEEHGIFDETYEHPAHIYDKHMRYTPEQRAYFQKEASHKNMYRAFRESNHDDFDEFTTEEMEALRKELNGDEFNRGGSVTLPDNYRKGGRVRMI